MEKIFKVYYNYNYSKSFDEGCFETVKLPLNEDEYERLISAANSGIPFSEAESVKDIYDRVIEISKKDDFEFFESHRDVAINEINFNRYIFGGEVITCSPEDFGDNSVKIFVEEIYRVANYPDYLL